MSISVAVHSTVMASCIVVMVKPGKDVIAVYAHQSAKPLLYPCRYRCYRRRLTAYSDHRGCNSRCEWSTAIMGHMQWVASRGALTVRMQQRPMHCC